MKTNKHKRKDSAQRLRDRKFNVERFSELGQLFQVNLLMRMGLSDKSARLVCDLLDTHITELNIMEETLKGIAASPRNRGARRYALATIEFIDAMRIERSKSNIEETVCNNDERTTLKLLPR